MNIDKIKECAAKETQEYKDSVRYKTNLINIIQDVKSWLDNSKVGYSYPYIEEIYLDDLEEHFDSVGIPCVVFPGTPEDKYSANFLVANTYSLLLKKYNEIKSFYSTK